MAAVAAIYDQLKYINTEVLAISTDSVYSHKIFTELSPSVQKVTFPLLSDRTHKISKAYRVLNDKEGAPLRATIIIDPEGKIVTKFVNPMEVGRNAYEILRVIQGIQYARRTQEGVPANWVPGQPGIIRDPNYIGKI
ncbi:alkyl hydroperoxide reductase [Neobacillus cucumis]|uniref:Alkyl hydroperoxide reductase n=1 Tax=Neobacillus cucumis TaxID=1740721 RepID=A0A2N5H8L0_9BACI|nr:alkyl hydroperoxide reductase [Neobacillus cucumis]